MDVTGCVAVVTGAGSGLGRGTATVLTGRGARVLLVDLPDSAGARVAEDLGPLARFAAADVSSDAQVAAVFAVAESMGPVRAVVHCAGRGGGVYRLLDPSGELNPGALERFETLTRVNLVGTFVVLRRAAATIVRSEPHNGERGAIVLTSSIAGFEGQAGQLPYAATKAAINGMTLVAARDLADHQIRVNTIAPGLFDTAMLSGLPPDARTRMENSVPHPRRLGTGNEFGAFAVSLLENPMINGETVRLDAGNRLPSGL